MVSNRRPHYSPSLDKTPLPLVSHSPLAPSFPSPIDFMLSLSLYLFFFFFAAFVQLLSWMLHWLRNARNPSCHLDASTTYVTCRGASVSAWLRPSRLFLHCFSLSLYIYVCVCWRAIFPLSSSPHPSFVVCACCARVLAISLFHTHTNARVFAALCLLLSLALPPVLLAVALLLSVASPLSPLLPFFFFFVVLHLYFFSC